MLDRIEIAVDNPDQLRAGGTIGRGNRLLKNRRRGLQSLGDQPLPLSHAREFRFRLGDLPVRDFQPQRHEGRPAVLADNGQQGRLRRLGIGGVELVGPQAGDGRPQPVAGFSTTAFSVNFASCAQESRLGSRASKPADTDRRGR